MNGRSRGRPASPEITQALLAAAREVMQEKGYGSLTVDGLTARVGTSRPAFYRRFPTLGHLACEVLLNEYQASEAGSEGNLETDLLRLQQEDLAMFTSPLMRKNLVGLLEAVRSDSSLRDLYRTRFISPRRQNVERLISSAVRREEIPPPSVSLALINDLLVGPLLSRAVLPLEEPLDDELAQETVSVVMSVLRDSSSERPGG